MTNKHLFFAPHPALRDIVNNIMIAHTISDSGCTNLSFPFPPLPEHSIIFYPHDIPRVENPATNEFKSLYACTVTGPQTQRTILSLGHNHLIIKIGLQPGALYRLLRQPMERMLQIDYDGESVFGGQVRYAIDAFANAEDFDEMKDIANAFMLNHIAKVKTRLAIDYVIPEIIRYGGTRRIDNLVRTAYLGNRQFERAFKARMGVSPKFFSRLVRFGNAWLLKENNPGITWTEVAHQCMYFDQMHLIRDFKAFTNCNPKEISAAFENQPFQLQKRIFY